MSKKKRKKVNVRESQPMVGIVANDDILQGLCIRGYTTLNRNPEFIAGCMRIADLIGSMTIMLMNNTKNGRDERIFNALSRKIDIEPCKDMTRIHWMSAIVMNLMAYGNGNSVALPITKGGMIEEILPIPAGNVTFQPSGHSYEIRINGQAFDPEDVLHFVINPDEHYLWKGKGYKVLLQDVVQNLAQARATEKAFSESKFMPPIILKVDALADEFASPEGRTNLLDQYIKTSEAGEPWIIPAEQFSVETVKPLSLTDLAIYDGVKLNKKTVASILGIPPFVLGEGEFNEDEWNNFISTRIKPIAEEIEQELNRKIVVNPKWHFKFDIRSLISYDLLKRATIVNSAYKSGYVSGNEAREEIGFNPADGLDRFVILENYLPIDQIDKQKKVKGNE